MFLDSYFRQMILYSSVKCGVMFHLVMIALIYSQVFMSWVKLLIVANMNDICSLPRTGEYRVLYHPLFSHKQRLGKY